MLSTLPRVAAVTALVLTALSWGAGSQAAPGDAATATVSAAACADQAGAFTIELTAGSSETYFTAFVAHPYADGESRDVELDAGESSTITFDGLDDETYRVVVDYFSDDEGDTLVDDEVIVACDAAPEGPYTNPRGKLSDDCGYVLEVAAANKPTGGNIADLQPVTFTVTYLPEEPPTEEPGDGETEEPGDGETEEPGDGETEEPGDGETEEPVGGETEEPAPRSAALEPIVLDTFVLDATTPTYLKSFTAPGDGYFFGTFVLKAGDTVIDTMPAGFCVAAPASGESGGPSVVNTGA